MLNIISTLESWAIERLMSCDPQYPQYVRPIAQLVQSAISVQ